MTRVLVEVDCPVCGGSGEVAADPGGFYGEPCEECDGEGFLEPPTNDDAFDELGDR